MREPVLIVPAEVCKLLQRHIIAKLGFDGKSYECLYLTNGVLVREIAEPRVRS